VGQTVKSLRVRWLEHVNEANTGCPRPLYRAIRKYGVEAFEVLLLQEVETSEEMNSMELKWGLHLNALSPLGYSLRLGDSSGPVSKETRELRRRLMTGKKASEETREKLRSARLVDSPSTKDLRSASLRSVFANPQLQEQCRVRVLGSRASDETRRKQSEAAKKRSAPVVSREIRSAAARKWQQSRKESI
jgi:hypothetical protein